MTSAESQMKVFHAPRSPRTSSQVRTRVARSTARPRIAAVVLWIPSALPKIHRISSKAKVASMTHSSRFIRPISASLAPASSAASGVAFTCGG